MVVFLSILLPTLVTVRVGWCYWKLSEDKTIDEIAIIIMYGASKKVVIIRYVVFTLLFVVFINW